MPSVSIVIPVYNGGDLVAPCLDSVLSQTVSDFELIVVDDGSTDTTPQTLASYAATDTRIHVLTHAERTSAGIARNDGMAEATGDYLLFLDADDLVEPTLLERAHAPVQAYDADMVLFGADMFEGDDLSERYANPYLLDASLIPDKQPFDRDVLPTRIFQLCTPEPWTKLFKRSFIEQEQLTFQDLPNANDLACTLTALATAERIAAITDVLVHHRLDNPNSVQAHKGSEPHAFLDALWELKASLVSAELFDELETSFVNLALFHCLYNDAAPLDWPTVFSELGILQHPRSDFYLEGDYDRCADMVLTCGIDELAASDACADFWHTCALHLQEQLRQTQEQLQQAQEDARQAQHEIDLIQQSRSYRLGTTITSVPRKLRSSKES